MIKFPAIMYFFIQKIKISLQMAKFPGKDISQILSFFEPCPGELDKDDN